MESRVKTIAEEMQELRAELARFQQLYNVLFLINPLSATPLQSAANAAKAALDQSSRAARKETFSSALQTQQATLAKIQQEATAVFATLDTFKQQYADLETYPAKIIRLKAQIESEIMQLSNKLRNLPRAASDNPLTSFTSLIKIKEIPEPSLRYSRLEEVWEKDLAASSDPYAEARSKIPPHFEATLQTAKERLEQLQQRCEAVNWANLFTDCTPTPFDFKKLNAELLAATDLPTTFDSTLSSLTQQLAAARETLDQIDGISGQILETPGYGESHTELPDLLDNIHNVLSLYENYNNLVAHMRAIKKSISLYGNEHAIILLNRLCELITTNTYDKICLDNTTGGLNLFALFEDNASLLSAPEDLERIKREVSQRSLNLETLVYVKRLSTTAFYEKVCQDGGEIARKILTAGVNFLQSLSARLEQAIKGAESDGQQVQTLLQEISGYAGFHNLEELISECSHKETAAKKYEPHLMRRKLDELNRRVKDNIDVFQSKWLKSGWPDDIHFDIQSVYQAFQHFITLSATSDSTQYQVLVELGAKIATRAKSIAESKPADTQTAQAEYATQSQAASTEALTWSQRFTQLAPPSSSQVLAVLKAQPKELEEHLIKHYENTASLVAEEKAAIDAHLKRAPLFLNMLKSPPFSGFLEAFSEFSTLEEKRKLYLSQAEAWESELAPHLSLLSSLHPLSKTVLTASETLMLTQQTHEGKVVGLRASLEKMRAQQTTQAHAIEKALASLTQMKDLVAAELAQCNPKNPISRAKRDFVLEDLLSINSENWRLLLALQEPREIALVQTMETPKLNLSAVDSLQSTIKRDLETLKSTHQMDTQEIQHYNKEKASLEPLISECIRIINIPAYVLSSSPQLIRPADEVEHIKTRTMFVPKNEKENYKQQAERLAERLGSVTAITPPTFDLEAYMSDIQSGKASLRQGIALLTEHQATITAQLSTLTEISSHKISDPLTLLNTQVREDLAELKRIKETLIPTHQMQIQTLCEYAKQIIKDPLNGEAWDILNAAKRAIDQVSIRKKQAAEINQCARPKKQSDQLRKNLLKLIKTTTLNTLDLETKSFRQNWTSLLLESGLQPGTEQESLMWKTYYAETDKTKSIYQWLLDMNSQIKSLPALSKVVETTSEVNIETTTNWLNTYAAPFLTKYERLQAQEQQLAELDELIQQREADLQKIEEAQQGKTEYDEMEKKFDGAVKESRDKLTAALGKTKQQLETLQRTTERVLERSSAIGRLPISRRALHDEKQRFESGMPYKRFLHFLLRCSPTLQKLRQHAEVHAKPEKRIAILKFISGLRGCNQNLTALKNYIRTTLTTTLPGSVSLKRARSSDPTKTCELIQELQENLEQLIADAPTLIFLEDLKFDLEHPGKESRDLGFLKDDPTNDGQLPTFLFLYHYDKIIKKLHAIDTETKHTALKTALEQRLKEIYDSSDNDTMKLKALKRALESTHEKILEHPRGAPNPFLATFSKAISDIVNKDIKIRTGSDLGNAIKTHLDILEYIIPALNDDDEAPSAAPQPSALSM